MLRSLIAKTTALILLFTGTLAHAQWERENGTAFFNRPTGIVETLDGGYITSGAELYDCCCADSSDGWLMKLFPNGSVDFRVPIDLTQFDQMASVREVDDAFGPGYVVVGFSGDAAYYASGVRKVYIARTDANGNVIWIHSYDPDSPYDYHYNLDLEVVTAFDPLVPGGAFAPVSYIVAGTRQRPGAGKEGFLLNVDLSGSMNWMKSYLDTRYGPVGSNSFFDVEQVPDVAGLGSSLIVSGVTAPTTFGDENGFLLLTDLLGNQIWANDYGYGTFGDTCMEVTPTSDGGFATTRRVPLNPLAIDTASAASILKVDFGGTPQWQVQSSGLNLTGEIRERPSGDLAFIGWAYSTGFQQPEMVLASVNSSGGGVFSWRYDGPDYYDSAASFDITQSDEFVVLGQSGYCCHDYYMIRTDSLGRTGCEADLPLQWVDHPVPQVPFDFGTIDVVGQMPPPFTQNPVPPVETLLCESVIAPPPPPFDVSVSVSGSDVTLTWDNGTMYDEIEIIRDGATIASIGGGGTVFFDIILAPARYLYEVRGINVDGASNPSERAAALVGITDVVYLAEDIEGQTDATCDIEGKLEGAGQHPCAAYSPDTFFDIILSLEQPVNIWVMLGTAPFNRELRASEAAVIVEHLLNYPGSALYIEGGDLNVLTSSSLGALTSTAVVDTGAPDDPIFGLQGEDSGLGLDVSPFAGAYVGESTNSDHLQPIGGAAGAIFRNVGPTGQTTAVFSDGMISGFGDYRTIVSSTELAAFQGDRQELVEAYLAAFAGGTPVVTFERGDCNSDGGVNLADVIRILAHLFSDEPIVCDDACDVSDDGAVDLSDGIGILSFVFSGGAAPAAPFGLCGMDPTGDALDCAAFPACP